MTDDQAGLVAQAIALALENSTEDQVGEAEQDLKTLAVFFATVATEPQRFPVTGRMATKLAKIQRENKPPVKKVSRRNARKQRQLDRQGGAKRRRAERKENVANFNAAREAYLADFTEMQQIQEQDQARAEVLLTQDHLHRDELVEILTLIGAPPQIVEAAGRVVAEDDRKLLLPPGVES